MGSKAIIKSPVDMRADNPPSGRRLVYVIDDNAELRQSLAFLLAAGGIDARVFASGESFLAELPSLVPAPVLLDVRMAGVDGVGVLAEMVAAGVTFPVVMMTGHGDIAVAIRSMKLGAIDFLEKPFEAEALTASFDRAFAILDEMADTLRLQAAARQQLACLTPRESDVVHALVDGAPNKIVAYRLALSPRTVEMHRANAFAKLGLHNIAELVKLVGSSEVAVALPAQVAHSQRHSLSFDSLSAQADGIADITRK